MREAKLFADAAKAAKQDETKAAVEAPEQSAEKTRIFIIEFLNSYLLPIKSN